MSKKNIAGKYTFVVAAGIAATLLAAPVFAQTKPAPTPPVAAASPAEDKAAEARKFDSDKQTLLKKMDDFMARMQKKRACIQASADQNSMNICFVTMAQTAAPKGNAGNGKTDAGASGSAPAPQPQPPVAPPAAKK